MFGTISNPSGEVLDYTFPRWHGRDRGTSPSWGTA